MSNRVKKIQEHSQLEWHHVPTTQNPADLGSQGGNVVDNKLWQHGPEWLSDKTKWPPEVIFKASTESDKEIKGERRSQALLTSSENTETNVFDSLLERYPLRKVLRICAWIQRFIKNSRVKPEARKTGPLESSEVKERDIWWIKKSQGEAEANPKVEEIKRELNLQPNEMGILECRGRIEGEYPI